MTHKKVSALFSDYTKGRTSHEERVAIEKHIGTCKRCAKRLTEFLIGKVHVIKIKNTSRKTRKK